MDIIFVKLPRYLDIICIILKKIGFRVFYLELSSGPIAMASRVEQRADNLKKSGVIPLPIENLSEVPDYFEIINNSKKKAFDRPSEIAPEKFLGAFKDFFPEIRDITKKLHIAVHSVVTNQIAGVNVRVALWARANPDTTHLIFDVNYESLTIPVLAPNVKRMVIPVHTIAVGITGIFRTLRSAFNGIMDAGSRNCTGTAETMKKPENPSRVAYVVHKGLNYGDLFQKDVYYSVNNSDLCPERLLHVDYSGIPSPSDKLRWICLGNHRHSWAKNFYFALCAVSAGVLNIRHPRHILGLSIITRFYVVYKSFSKQLEEYPDLKLALIDYEILCPKELLLAFESKGIETLAVQERFILAFHHLYGSTILNHYLCGSNYAIESMKESPLYSIGNYSPVGQYRSDILVNSQQSPPPQVLLGPISRGAKIITALGYHTHTEWYNSQTDILLNWTAHRHFLEEMIRLSNDIPGVFIIVRYKNIDWISLPVFAEIVQKINESKNITISLDYETNFYSYDLCAHSDLVIAKRTSLADECLSIGIPVLFHEYTHNTEKTTADTFDYTPAKILCFSYQELLERTRIILQASPNSMTPGFEYLKNVTYGGLGDGRVKERIHTHIEKVLLES